MTAENFTVAKKMWRADTINDDWRTEARNIVLGFAGVGEAGEDRGSVFRRAAKNSQRTFSRMRSLFYGKGNPPPEEMEALKRDLEQWRVKRAWKDMESDQRLAAMTAEFERLKRDVQDLGRAIASVHRSLSDETVAVHDEAGSGAWRRRSTDR